MLLQRLTLDADIGGGGGGMDGGAGIDGGELAEREDVEDRVEELLLVLERVDRRVRLNWLKRVDSADGFAWLLVLVVVVVVALVRVEAVDEVLSGADMLLFIEAVEAIGLRPFWD